QNRTQPDRAHPAQAETCPVAMGGEMSVEQRRQTHPLHLLQQQWNVVDALCDDDRYRVHPQSLAQSGIDLQIWANRETSYPGLFINLKNRLEKAILWSR